MADAITIPNIHELGPNDSPPTAIELLISRACQTPDLPFLTDVGGDQTAFVEAHRRVREWVGALRALDIGEGAVVSTMNPTSVTSTLLWLALASAGAQEAPVHPLYKGYMLEHAIRSVGAETMFVHYDYLDRVAASTGNLGGLRRLVIMGSSSRELPDVPFDLIIAEDLLASAQPVATLAERNPWDIAAIVYTSGTTGPSKGVLVPWNQLAAFALRLWPYQDLTSDDVMYVFTPSSHIGSKLMTYLSALIGCELVIRPEFSISEFLTDVRTHGVTTTVLVGAIARFLEQLPPDPHDHQIPLRNIAMAPLVPDLDGFKERFGVRICSGYSSTELSSPITTDGWTTENWKSAGRLSEGWPWCEARVVDEHDREVAPGEVGELIVRTGAPWALNAGYFGMPEASMNAWRNGWFHTGDGFTVDENGYYYFVDRIKDAIRRRGENVSSFEVEAIVNEHDAVLESAAVAVPSDLGEDEILVYVVPKPGADVDPKELIKFLIPRMPRYMIPRYITVTHDLPKTVGTMRTQKAQLRTRGIPDGTWDREEEGITLPRQ